MGIWQEMKKGWKQGIEQSKAPKPSPQALTGVQLRHAQAVKAVKEGIRLGCKQYEIYGPYDKPEPCIGVGKKFNLVDASKNAAPLPPCNSECTCSVHLVFD